MAEHAEELALEAAREGGKPLADSKVEVARAIDGMKNCVEVIRSEHGEEIPMSRNAAPAANRMGKALFAIDHILSVLWYDF